MIDMERVTISGGTFAKSDLGGMGAMDSKFSMTSFRRCNLSGATFTDCTFHDVSFDEAYMEGARFSSCHFVSCTARGATLNGVTFAFVDRVLGLEMDEGWDRVVTIIPQG